MQSLLISEPPLQVLPSLAVKLGSVDKAIILQQIHYWLLRSKNIEDGHRWVWNTVKDWHDQFPWLSERTVKRYLKQLEDDGYLITANYNPYKFDRTKWYRIAYDKLEQPWGTTGTTKGNERNQAKGPAVPTYTREYTETTTENTNTPLPPKGGDQAEPDNLAEKRKQVVEYLNQKIGSKYRPGSSATKTHLDARFKDGFTVADCKQVIDKKVAEWGNSPQWSKYLRPATLFGSKFESYLNQPVVKDQRTPPKNNGYAF